MNTESKMSLKEMATAMGFVELGVQLRSYPDGASEAMVTRNETVKVRQLPVKLYPQMSLLLEDQIGLAALYCRGVVDDGARKWAEELSPASHGQVIEMGKEINWDFFCSWVSWQKEMAARRPKQDLEEIGKVLEVMSRTSPDVIDALSKKMMSVAGLTQVQEGKSTESQTTSSGSGVGPKT